MMRLLTLAILIPGCSLVLDISEPRELSLQSLSIRGAVLTPAFSPDQTRYTTTVSPTERLIVEAEPSNEFATILIDGETRARSPEYTIDLRPGGVRTVSVGVESPSGVSVTYQIDVTVGGVDFGEPIRLAIGGPMVSNLASGDFNNDGKRDLGLLDSFTQVYALAGRGDGSFLFQPGLPALTPISRAVALADLDEDAKEDLIVTDDFGVTVRSGNGDGSFAAPIQHQFGGMPSAMAVADLTGDGHLDVVVAHAGSSILVLNGDGAGGLTSGVSAPAGGNPQGLIVGEFPDSGLDVAVVNTAAFTVLRNTGTGFTPQERAIEMPQSIAAGDFDQDGTPDFALAIGTMPTIEVVTDFFNSTAQSFTIDAMNSQVRRLIACDFDSDGRTDLAFLTEDRLGVAFADGGYAPLFYDLPAAGTELLCDDFNGDGQLDLAITSAAGADVSVKLGVKL